MADRDAAQVLHIALLMQADLIEALLVDGSLKPERARPLVGRLLSLASSWKCDFDDGADMLSEPLARLRMRVGLPPG